MSDILYLRKENQEYHEQVNQLSCELEDAKNTLSEVRTCMMEAQHQEYIVKQEIQIWARAIQEYLKDGKRSRLELLKFPEGMTQ